MQPWSFNQPVLLNKSRHNRSVLVWTVAGATAFAGAWAFLAPLPETVALQGKLQPARPVQDIESAVDGLVAAVPVKEGDSVAVGDLLVRFDPRDAETRLQAARRKRSQLQSQIAINRVVLGEQDATVLTPNQQQQLVELRQQMQGINTAAEESLAASQARLKGLIQTLTIARDVAARYEALVRDGATSEMSSNPAKCIEQSDEMWSKPTKYRAN